MYWWYLNFHIIAGVSWIIFLLQFIRERKLVFNVLSLFFMIAVLGIGTKVILLNPSIAKSGAWLHTKLSFVILLMIENLYLSFIFFIKKDISEFLSKLLYWITYAIFIIILVLSLFRPF